MVLFQYLLLTQYFQRHLSSNFYSLFLIEKTMEGHSGKDTCDDTKTTVVIEGPKPKPVKRSAVTAVS